MSLSATLLMIDDDVALGDLLCEYLGRFGHRLLTAVTATEGACMLQSQKPDLLILDIMLPDIDGLTLCRRIRADHDLPIIMLTARGEVADRVVGLELGADDYLAKPFEPRELVARIDTVLRRVRVPDRAAIRRGELVLEPERRRVTHAGRELELTTSEFDLLHVLMAGSGRVMSRDTLLAMMHGGEAVAFDRAIDMVVSRLRQKLGDDPRSPKLIKTVRGVGYQFVG